MLSRSRLGQPRRQKAPLVIHSLKFQHSTSPLRTQLTILPILLGIGQVVLRVLRVMRPLRTIKRFPQLRVLTNALIEAMGKLRDIFVLGS